MFRNCPLTDDYPDHVLMNDSRTLECLQGAYFGTEYQGTRACSLSIYTNGRAVFMMGSDMYEMPAGELEVTKLWNTSVSYFEGGELSRAYSQSKSTGSQLILTSDRSGLAFGALGWPFKDQKQVFLMSPICEFR
jgi:hypothetical protein